VEGVASGRRSKAIVFCILMLAFIGPMLWCLTCTHPES
jgi:hypothetical protein